MNETLKELKAKLMDFNKQKKPVEILDFIYILVISIESLFGEVWEVRAYSGKDYTSMSDSEKGALRKELKQLSYLLNFIRSLLNKARFGRDFEKALDLLINKIDKLPERIRKDLLNHIANTKSGNRFKNQENETLSVLYSMSKTLIDTLDLELKYELSKLEGFVV